MDAARTRVLSASLGLLNVAVGAGLFAAPRLSARMFGVPLAAHPAADVVVRSVGARDAVIGMGMWSAATHGGNYAPWVLARLLCDAGDTAAVAVAVARGGRDPRLFALGGLALGAVASGLVLYLAARKARGAA